MDLIYIGKLVNTHGLKGEVKIISDFKYKETIFKKGNYLNINNNKYLINSYRPHKMFDMVILDGITSIEQAENLKGHNVYVDRLEYDFEGYLNEDLIGLSVYDKDIYKGKVIDIISVTNNDLLVIGGIKKHMVPLIPHFIKNVDLDNKKIEIEYIEGLDNEN